MFHANFHHFTISLFRYFAISLFRYFAISLFRYFAISPFRYFAISLFRHFTIFFHSFPFFRQPVFLKSAIWFSGKGHLNQPVINRRCQV
jgi:hypothetical protein